MLKINAVPEITKEKRKLLGRILNLPFLEPLPSLRSFGPSIFALGSTGQDEPGVGRPSSAGAGFEFSVDGDIPFV